MSRAAVHVRRHVHVAPCLPRAVLRPRHGLLQQPRLVMGVGVRRLVMQGDSLLVLRLAARACAAPCAVFLTVAVTSSSAAAVPAIFSSKCPPLLIPQPRQ